MRGAKKSSKPKKAPHRPKHVPPTSYPSLDEFRQFFELAGVMFVKLDSRGRVTLVNRTTCETLGYAARSIVGKDWFANFIPARIRKDVVRGFRQLMRGRLMPMEFFENSVLTRKGEERIIAWHNAMLRDSHGRIVGTLSAGQDISEQRRAEQQLAEKEENLRVTLNSIGDAVIVTDRDGTVVHMNPAAVKLTGWPLKQARGRPLESVFKIVNSLTGQKARDPFHLVIARGHTVGLANHTKLISKTGRQYHIADSAAPIRFPDGSVRGVVIVFKDVSRDYAHVQALRQSEERLRSFFDGAKDGIVVANARTRRIVEVNPRVLAMLRCSRQDLVGATIDVLHPAAHLGLIRETFARISKRKQNLVLNIPVQRQDGSIFTADINAVPLDWGGQSCVVGIFRDVTPRLEIEQALRESEAKFRRIIETTPHGIHLYRLRDDGQLIFVGANPAADQILGIHNADLIGKTIEEAFPPLAMMDIPEAYRTVARTGQPWKTEHVAYQDNRIVGVYDVHAFQTEPFGVAAMFEDVTTRKALERALRENEHRYHSLIDHSPDYILRIDRQAKVQLASSSLLHVLHLPMEGRSGMLLDELGLPPPLSTLLLKEIRAVFETGDLKTIDVEVTLGGKPMCLDIRLVPEANDDGELATVLAVARDVTALERMEQQIRQSEKMTAIGQLAGGIAHDFNNQLAGIMGYAELLKFGFESQTPDPSHVAGILKAIERATDLTGKLLAFSRRGKYEQVDMDLGAIVQEVIALLQHSVDKRIQIVYVPPAAPLYVQGDPTQLENVFLNIGINARDAMPQGGKLTFELSSCDLDESFCRESIFGIAPGPYARVSVTDTGVGMSSDVQTRLFEPFFTTKEKGHGTGMGLAAAFGAMKRHQGAITVRTAPGQGSTFTFYLPSSKPGPRGVVSSSGVEQGTQRLDGRILLVEDEATVAEVGRCLLEAMGCRVVVCQHGQDAIQAFQQSPDSFDLVILDMILPAMHGRAVFEALRTVRPGVRVLVSSGYALDQEAQEVLKAGAIGFVPKPFTMVDLRSAVARALHP